MFALSVTVKVVLYGFVSISSLTKYSGSTISSIYPPAHAPMSLAELNKYDGLATRNQVIAYQSKVGSIQYLASAARPDIAFTASKSPNFSLTLLPSTLLKRIASSHT
ncbi:hypothetical protein V1509DRAFT_636253 [Lipomyces kononenkoae]